MTKCEICQRPVDEEHETLCESCREWLDVSDGGHPLPPVEWPELPFMEQ